MDTFTFHQGNTTPVEIDSETAELIRIVEIGTDERRDEAVTALTEAGTKALPGLLLAFADPAKKELMDQAGEILKNWGDPVFSSLEILLREADPVTRSSAAGALGYLGKPAIPYLIPALNDPSRDVRTRAARSIARIGGTFPPEQIHEQVLCDVILGDTKDLIRVKKAAFPHLVELLDDTDYRIRVGAIKGLGDIKSVRAVSRLVRLIKSDEIEVRSAIVEALGKIGNTKVIPFLVPALSDTSPYVRIEAVWSLEKLGWTPKNNQQMVRYLIAKEQWGKLARIDTGALPALLPALADENPNIRNNVTAIFLERGTAAIPALYSAQNSPEENLKKAAGDLITRISRNSGTSGTSGVLGNIGNDSWLLSNDEIPEEFDLSSEERDEDAEKKPESPETHGEKIRRFSGLLANPDPAIRVVAVEELRAMGLPAIRPLGNALHDPDPQVRSAASEALGSIRAVHAVSALIRLLRTDPDKNVRISSARALGAIRDAYAIPPLAEQLSDPETGIRAAAAAALGAIGKPALHAIIQKVHDANPLGRAAAYQALGVMQDPGVVTPILRGFEDADPEVRVGAAYGLETFAHKRTKKFLEIIPGLLISGTPAGRGGILEILAKLDSEEVLWIAYAVREDPDPRVREKAQEIIRKREPGLLFRQNGSTGEQDDEKTLINFIAQLTDPDPAARGKAVLVLKTSGALGTRLLLSSFADCSPDTRSIILEIIASKKERAINELIDAIHNESSLVREATVTLLGNIPQERAVYALGWVLYGEKNVGIRRLAAGSLGSIGSKSAIPSLVHSMADAREVRLAAIEALGKIGGTEACEALITNLAAADDETLPEVARALAPCGETARTSLMATLAKNSPEFRLNVAKVIDLLSWQPDDINGQIRYLVAKGEWDRISALGLPALEYLVASFDDEATENRAEVARIIGHLGEPARESLHAGLADKNPFIREGCATALGYLGKKSEKQIVRLLNDPAAPVRLAAAGALDRMGWDPANEAAAVLYDIAKKSWDNVLTHKKFAVPALVRILGDVDFDVQSGAIRTLGKTGDNRAVPYLIILAEKSGDIRIVQEVIAALGGFTDPKVLEFLQTSLTHPVFAVRSQAASVLEKTGWVPQDTADTVRFLVALQRPAALARMGSEIVPVLIEALDDDQVLGRLVITESLISMGDEAAAGLSAIIKSDNRHLHREARNMLALIKKRERPGKGGFGPENAASETRFMDPSENAAVRLEEIRTLLRSADDLTKQNAADTLARLGTAAIPDLTQLAAEENPEVQVAAIQALGQVKSSDALSVLIPLRTHKNPDIRRAVIAALGNIRHQSAIPYFIQGFLDPAGAVRSESVHALAGFGSLALHPVIEATDRSEPAIRAGALETLGKLPEPVVLYPLIKGLSDPADEVRAAAAKVLSALAKQSDSGVLEILIRLQSEGDLLTRLTALGALAGNDDVRALDLIMLLTHDENERIRVKAEEILMSREKGFNGKSAGEPGFPQVQDIPRLIRDLSDSERDVRTAAITGLAGYGSAAVVPLLLAYSPGNTETCTEILRVLEVMGGTGAENLEQALEHNEVSVRYAAAQAIGRLRLFRSVPALGHALYAEPDPDTRGAIADSLGLIGDPSGVKPLIDALEDPGRGVQIAAIHSLGVLRDDKAVEPLIRQLNSPDEDILLAAADSIRQIGEPARPGLVTLLRTGDHTRKAIAANILECLNLVPREPVEHAYYLIGKERWYDFEDLGEAALEPLIEALSDKNTHIRLGAVNALAKLGGIGIFAPLISALNDASPIVRLRAENALVNAGTPVIENLENALDQDRLMYPQTAMHILQRIGMQSHKMPLVILPETGPKTKPETEGESEPPAPLEEPKNDS
ncbi:MAG: HEAT repeat domain-containing protein [Methanoregula sp.]|jgi:HEAT repeat protein